MTTFATNTVPFNTNPNNTNCPPNFGYPNYGYQNCGYPTFNSPNFWQNCCPPMNAAFPFAGPATQPWQWNNSFNSTPWNCGPTGAFNHPYGVNSFNCPTGDCGYPCFPFNSSNTNSAWNTGWNTSPFSFGGGFGPQSFCQPQNWGGFNPNCFTPSYPTNFGQYSNFSAFNSGAYPTASTPWNCAPAWNNAPVNAWGSAYTQNCGPNCCPTGAQCPPFNCTPNFPGNCFPFNSYQNSPLTCGTPSCFPQSNWNTFNPMNSGWNTGAYPTNAWYGNTGFNSSYCPAPSCFTPWQNMSPFHSGMNTPWNCFPGANFAGHPMHGGFPFAGATYPTSGFVAPGAVNPGQPMHRPTENGELGYNLQRNAA